MSLQQRYKLLEAIPDASQTADQELLGREIASGRPVTLHLLAHDRENEGTLRQARNVPPEQSQYVLDYGEFHGRPYVVTQILPGNLSLRRWLASVAPVEHRVEESADAGVAQRAGVFKVPDAPAPAGDDPAAGEFARFFQTPPRPEAATPRPPSSGGAPAKPPHAAPLKVEMEKVAASTPAEPGEFTRLFQAPVIPGTAAGSRGDVPAPPRTDAVEVKPDKAAAPPPAPPQAEPGEFTQLFQAPVAAGTAVTPIPSQGHAPTPPQVTPVEVKPDKPVAPAPPPQAEPGEFTRLFQAPVAAGAAAASRGDVPAPPRTDAVRGKPDNAVAPPPPPQQAEPGEFTRLFQAPVPQTPPAYVEPTTPAIQPPRRSVPGDSIRQFQAPLEPGPAVTPQMKPGEFTRLFQAPAAPSASKADPAPPPAPPLDPDKTRLFHGTVPRAIVVPPVPPRVAAVPAAQPKTPAQAEPSEFTRMFQAPAAPGTPGTGAPPPSPAPAGSPLRAAEPGEFTGLFQSPLSGKPEPQYRPPSSSQPGEFTRMMDSPFSEAGGSRPAPPDSWPGARPPASGEFTRMFGPQSGGSPANQAGSDATRAFALPVPQPPHIATPAVPSGPGEFTRMFPPPTTPAAPPVASPSVSVPHVSAKAPLPSIRKPKISYTILFIVMGVLLLTVVVLVVIFALRS